MKNIKRRQNRDITLHFYNDYVILTKRYLKNYRLFKVSVKNLTSDLNYIRNVIAKDIDLAATIGKYGDKMSSGSNGITQTEAAFEQRQELLNKAQSIENNIHELWRIIVKIEKALDGLKEEDAEIVRDYYILGQNWDAVGEMHGYSESWVKKKGNKAVKAVALMIFGLKVNPDQRTVVFAE